MINHICSQQITGIEILEVDMPKKLEIFLNETEN